MKTSIARSIAAFDKKTEQLVHAHEVVVEDVTTLRSKIGAPKEDPELFDSYPIKKEDAAFFATLLPKSFVFDFRRFDYFLEASSQ